MENGQQMDMDLLKDEESDGDEQMNGGKMLIPKQKQNKRKYKPF